MKPSRLIIKKHQQGLSLVEMLVAMLIGLVVSLAVYGVLNANEGRKRTTNSINDIDNVGIYTLHQLDQSIRSAGSGLLSGVKSSIGTADATDHTLGCQINAALNGTTLLPASASLSAPFANVPINFRIAPVIIFDGAAPAGDDIIMTMSGNGGLSETASKFYDAPQADSLSLPNLAGFYEKALVLITKPPSNNISPCLIEQVKTGFVAQVGRNTLPLDGAFYQSTINNIALSSFDIDSHVINLGLSPTFQLFGVGENSTLLRYDLLSLPSSDSTPPNPSKFADSIYRMHALYGIYSVAGDPNSLTWVTPTGDYEASKLLAGTPAANGTLASIKAIKIGIVMQASLPEKDTVSNKSITLFSGTDEAVTVNLPSNALNRRYKALEAVIPLRNGLIL